MVAWVGGPCRQSHNPPEYHSPLLCSSLPSWNNPLPRPWHCGQGESKFADKQRLLIATMGVMPWPAPLGASPFLLALPPSRELFFTSSFLTRIASLLRQRPTFLTLRSFCPLPSHSFKSNYFIQKKSKNNFFGIFFFFSAALDPVSTYCITPLSIRCPFP